MLAVMAGEVSGDRDYAVWLYVAWSCAPV